ncbi:MAG: RNA polymerase sigma factor, partial [Bradymonadaceae bacterium]
KALHFSLILRRVKALHDADDVYQGAVLRIFMKLDTLAEPGLFRAWASRIMINSAYMWMRSRARNTAVPLDDLDERRISANSAEISADELVEWRELYAETLSWMKGLEEYERDMIRRYAVEGQTMREIGEEYEITTAAAKAHVFRARSFLRGQRDHFYSSTS